MVLGMSIKEVYFDLIRRGLKKTEYRPMSLFYQKRFDEGFVTEIIFGHQGMRDKIRCKVKITEGPLPVKLRPEWHDIYKGQYHPGEVYHINITGLPKYFVCQREVNQKYPIKFG